MIYERGSVVLVPFPFADQTHYKKRPVLVLQDHTISTGLTQTVVACITSNREFVGQTRVMIEQDSEAGGRMGILTDSVIVLDKIATVENGDIVQKLGDCPLMGIVDDAHCLVLGLRRPPA